MEQLVVERKVHPDEVLKKITPQVTKFKVVAIGASTGGIESLLSIFEELPKGLPPILITQHIPYGFSSSFATRLNSESRLNIVEAKGGEILEKSCAYLAPGNQHLTIELFGSDYKIKLLDKEKVSRHKPSVDIMMRSVHNMFGNSAMGIMMTGMGDDGSIGMKDMYDSGAYTISQSKKTCVVFGMPRKANEIGAVVKQDVDLDKIVSEIINYSK